MPKVNYRKNCEKCGRSKADFDFYKYKNGEPLELCIDCLTSHVDNLDPDTFMWILQKLDIPYVESKWNEIRDKACDKAGPEGLTGRSVIGKYISQMKLKQWKDKTFADTGAIQQEAEAAQARSEEIQKEMESSMDEHIKEMQENYQNGLITKEAFDNFISTYTSKAPTSDYEVRYKSNPIDEAALAAKGKGKALFPTIGGQNLHEDLELDSVEDKVSLEDKKYLLLKWGSEFTTEEWLKLEELFNKYIDNISESELDIAREETIRQICKILLRMDKAINIQDLDAYQKLTKTFNDLSKAAKLEFGGGCVILLR